jgi:NADH-quinone oxidoreductase subunit A
MVTFEPIRCATILLPYQKMPSQYIPIVIFALLAAAFPGVSFVALSRVRLNVTADRTTEPAEHEPTPESPARSGYTLRFSIVAMLFVIFAAAIVFLFPWVIKFSQMGSYGLVIAAAFVGILLAGYAWLYQMGALDGI